MVTTRGRRASTVIEEPQLVTSRKQRAKGTSYPDEVDKFTANQAPERRLHKKRPSAEDIALANTDHTPRFKRRRKETPPSSPVHRKSSRPKSPATTRKHGSQDGNTKQDSPLQIAGEEASSPVTADQEGQQALLEEIHTKLPAIPASILSRKLQLRTLPVTEQFQALLEQIPGLEPCEAGISEAVDQIVKHWESLSLEDSNAAVGTTNASTELQEAALPILAYTSIQILHAFAHYSFKSLQQAITQPESDAGKIFAIYQNLFRIARSPFQSKHGFLVPPEQVNGTPESDKSIRIADLATFLNGCFGVEEIGFYNLHKQFWSIFQHHKNVSLIDRLQLLLLLKMQAYISAMSDRERSKECVLEDLFSEDLISQIATAGAGIIESSEEIIKFEDQIEALKQFLDKQANTDDATSTLKAQHPFNEFLQKSITYINHHFEEMSQWPLQSIAPMCDNIDSMQARSTDKLPMASSDDIGREISIDNASSTDDSTKAAQNQGSRELMDFQLPRYNHPVPQEAIPVSRQIQPTVETSPEPENSSAAEDIVAQAAKAAEEALLGFSQAEVQNSSGSQTNNSDKSSVPQESDRPQTTSSIQQNMETRQLITNPSQPYLQRSEQQAQSVQYYPHAMSSLYGPPPGHTQPTAVLYERARQVAHPKSSNVSRSKTASISQRRPWNSEEEQALMDGLDKVNGPHWSQILALYGPEGSINQTLRDRTQVQLNDKARNLKLFFLKSGIEVPRSLSFVTGELKSRAPNHASTLDDTPPRSALPSQGGQTNGNSTNPSAATATRNRISAATTTQSTSPMTISSLWQFPQPKSTYSSPYPPIRSNLSLVGDQSQSIEEDANQQNVADLATSAAAQVAAALANFNALDLPGMDLTGSIPTEINTLDCPEMAKTISARSDSETAEIMIKEVADIQPKNHVNTKQYSSVVAIVPQPESRKTFDTH